MTGSWSKDRQAIVQQIREKWEQSQFSEEEIFRVEGILDVNTLELLDFDNEVKWVIEYRGSPTSAVSTSTISTSTNLCAIGIKLVLVEFLTDCYVVKLVLVEIDYVVLTSTNFALYDFFKIPKIVPSEDYLYRKSHNLSDKKPKTKLPKYVMSRAYNYETSIFLSFFPL